MLKKLEANDIVKLIKVKTSIECDRGQYNQFLMSKLDDPKCLMIGHVRGDEVGSFALLIHSDLSPISNTVLLVDIWTTSHRHTIEIANEAKEWQCQLGVKKGLVYVDDSHSIEYMESFGLKKVANVYEWSID